MVQMQAARGGYAMAWAQAAFLFNLTTRFFRFGQ